MVLVDTSVWIRALARRPVYVSEMHRLLGLGEVGGHELIYGELLIGDKGGRRKLLSAYEHLQHAKPLPHMHIVELVRTRNLHGRGIGWIDVHLLASAIVARWSLWTADPRLDALASEFGVAYRIPS